MERRILGAGLMVMISSLLLMAGTASAHSAVTPQGDPGITAANCKITTKAASVNQGEFELSGTVGDVVEVECNPEVFPPGSGVEIADSQLYSRCSSDITWVEPNDVDGNYLKTESGRSITVGLDGDGNATVGLVAGPHCAVGDTMVSGHTEGPEYESFSASFAVLAAHETPLGVTVYPTSQVEDENSSSVIAIVEGEFPGDTEDMLRLASPELYSRCEVGDKLSWLRMNHDLVSGTKELVGGTNLEPTGDEAVRLDNDGNGFALAIGAESCNPGRSIIEADLETAPFTTEEVPFTILAPQPTEF